MTGLEFLKTLGPTLTALIAAFLFFYNIRKDKKAEKVQQRNNFLGGKEPVAYAAFKILREGFEGSDKEIKEQVYTVIQGCLFEGSNRARALLYHVVIKHRNGKYAPYFKEAYDHVVETSGELNDISTDELNRKKFDLRVSALEKILKADKIEVTHG